MAQKATKGTKVVSMRLSLPAYQKLVKRNKHISPGVLARSILLDALEKDDNKGKSVA